MSPSDKDLKTSQIWSLAAECAREGWDGNDAKSIDRRACVAAADFIRALPDSVPLPEPAPEPDGSVSLDWIQSRNRLLSLSVGASNRLAFAWLDGPNKGHGTTSFDGKTIPPEILEGVKRIVDAKRPSR
jgi:hypothetical protein